MDPSALHGAYLRAYHPERFLEFYSSLTPELHLLDNPSRAIPISPVAVLLDGGLEPPFVELAQTLWRVLENPWYQELCFRNIPGFMLDPAGPHPGAFPFGPERNIGCLDLHLQNGRPGLIEFMVLPPGMSGIYPGMLTRYHQYLDSLLPGSPLRSFAGGWDRERCEEAMISGVLGPGEVERVAIVDSEPEHQITFGEFRYLLDLIRSRRKVEGVIADPRQIRRRGSRVLAKGLPVDRIVNRVTQPDWLANRKEFGSYTRLLWESPEIFSYHPYLWFLGDKHCLALLSDPATLGRLDLTPSAKKLLEEVIPATFPLSLFRRPGNGAVDVTRLIERFGSPAGMVLKPASSHASKGIVFGPLHTPTADRLAEALQRIDPDDYVAMKLVPPPEIVVPRGHGALERWRFDIRLYVLNSTYVFSGARTYLGAYTNQVACRAFAPLYYVSAAD